ncbi:hypothetical protein BDV26DRAFT_260820 [Aspergillus bertholletiae]|uniref:Capsule synthesis protein CapA domain-containing protein n=1 Tax=Aspergillus bertholletiae TaxID=1226010 RepID=A0A5N7BAH3_9EURO|nr:hypothetical protein BDV26DRAFT_260820 [Aspergillus bertholletiae]
MAPPKSYTLMFTGDVMLGRLIDQLLPTHVHNPDDHSAITRIVAVHPALKTYSPRSPWGSALPFFRAADLNLINLETAVTTLDTPWPNKAFNYRMHPRNLDILKQARIDYVSLANNHTADFGVPGLVDTVRAVQTEGLAFAGAGPCPYRPAVLRLPRVGSSSSSYAGAVAGSSSRSSTSNTSNTGDKEPQYEIHIYSASDHPQAWAQIPQFNFLDYTTATRTRLQKTLLETTTSPRADGVNKKGAAAALKIFSVHWGANYAWRPTAEIRGLAHFLVDECGVDIVHGHSAHHVQGVEVYRGKLILYGCGDFVDDYAVDAEFRNDLGALWRVVVCEDRNAGTAAGLRLQRLEVVPTRCRWFGVEVLEVQDDDHAWVCEKVRELSMELGTAVNAELGRDGQVVVDLG